MSLQGILISCAGEVYSQSPISFQASADVLKKDNADRSKGKATLSYPIDGGSLLNVVIFDFEQQETWEHEKWVLPADSVALRSMFSTWGAKPRTLVEVSPPSRKPTTLSLHSDSHFLLLNDNTDTAPPRHPRTMSLGSVGSQASTDVHKRPNRNDG